MKKILILLLFVTTLSYSQIRTQWVESFETDGNGPGLRYVTNCQISNTPPYLPSNIHGSHTAIAQGEIELISRDYNITGIDSVTIDISIAASGLYKGNVTSGSGRNLVIIEKGDYLSLEWSIDGGVWNRLFQFIAPRNTTSNLFHDTNLNGTKQPNEPILTQDFIKFTKFATLGGNTIKFRVKSLNNSNPILFDYIRILGRNTIQRGPNYTRLLYHHCGQNITNLNYSIYSVDSASYDWEWSANGGTTVITARNFVHLNRGLLLTQYNTDYQIQVRAINTTTNEIGPWSTESCILRTGNPPVPKALNPCPQYLTNSKTLIYCTNIAATQYRVKVNGNVHLLASNSVRLYNLGYKSSGGYIIEFSALVNGNWTPWGESCEINIASTLARTMYNNTITITGPISTEELPEEIITIIDIMGRTVKYTYSDVLTIEEPAGIYYLITETEKIKIIKND